VVLEGESDKGEGNKGEGNKGERLKEWHEIQKCFEIQKPETRSHKVIANIK
jgi:hypothetical protein